MFAKYFAGIPEPLDESLVTRKRKDYIAPAAPPEKRRRTGTKDEKRGTATNGGAKSKSSVKSKGKPVKKPAPPPVAEEAHLSDEELSDDEDAIDDPDIMEDTLDGVNVTGLDALGTPSGSEDEDQDLDVDEFPDSGSDFVDSDEEVNKKALWSDDDDDDDVEEKLTAANIEGLSRKLDMQKAIEEAEAQAELEEGLTTNIAVDKPTILGGEDEDGRPITNLASQDLQLLRTRLTDTIRVLEDFKNLGEAGRSRQEYRDQMLQDVCAYFGYSEFLADKLLNLFPPREAFAFFEAQVNLQAAASE
jgi:25S rRNA (cytosine2870-C5)-methyltransferase